MLTFDFACHLVRRYGSPLYVYDVSEVQRRYEELRAILPDGASLLYSLKANPIPALCSCLSDLGCAAELSSSGELAIARKAGFDLKRALYTGPGKSDGEIEEAVRAGVGYFSCESLRDLRRLTANAAGGPQLLLRINPTEIAASGLSMSGTGTQFGFFEESLNVDLEGHLSGRERLTGVHIYQGSQLSSTGSLEASFRNSAAAAARISEQLGLSPRVFDLGGGFPWPFALVGKGRSLLPLQACLAGVRETVRAQTELWFESGRFLVASCGTLLSVVQNVKRPPVGAFQIILDAGIHHLGGMSGLQRIHRPSVSILTPRVDDVSNDGPAEADVFGPLCTPLDCFARGVRLSTLPDAGDCVQIPNVGAYGLTASLTGFLSRPPPLEVVVRGERIESVSRLRTGHALLACEVLGEDGIVIAK